MMSGQSISQVPSILAGPRPGAGAPKNNFNTLKDGEFSSQLRKALYEGTPQEWYEFLSWLKDDRFRARFICPLPFCRFTLVSKVVLKVKHKLYLLDFK
jgi:hypothetical protein